MKPLAVRSKAFSLAFRYVRHIRELSMMQNSRLVNPVFALVCIAQVALAEAAIGSTLPLSSITSDCLRAVLDCVVQASDSDLPLARWGKMEDPANDCKFICSDETLAIQVPATHHALNPEVKNLLAPRVLQDVSGDFSIEVKVRCFEPLTGVSSTNPISSKDISVGSGILVWQNEKNFFRLTQAAMSDRQRKVGLVIHQAYVKRATISAFGRTGDSEVWTTQLVDRYRPRAVEA